MEPDTVPMARCSACVNGRCLTPQACELPVLEPISRRRLHPARGEIWARFIGASLGVGGFLLFAHALAQRFFH